jgi:hypothetical protein
MAGARVTDPQTSHDAAQSVINITPLKKAILDVLQEAMTDEQLVFVVRRHYGPEFASESGIRSRRAELAREGYVEATGDVQRTLAGRMALVWVKA